MNLVQLRDVLELAACGNFTRAAENLCVTQPAVSHQLKTLEKELGITLFQRDTHALSLTDEGEEFCRCAEKVMAAMGELEETFGIKNTATGRLRLGLYMFHQVGNLNKIVVDFISKYNVRVNTFSVETSDAYRMLEDGRLDFAVVNCWDGEIPPELTGHTLARERLMILMSQQEPYASRSSLTLEDMSGICLLFDQWAPKIYAPFIRICREKGVQLTTANVDPDGPEMEIAAVKEGLGASLVKESTGQFYCGDNLALVPIEPPLYINTTLICRKKDRNHSPYASFIKHVLSYVEKGELKV